MSLPARGFETLAFFWAGVQAGGGKNLDAALIMTAEASFSIGSGVSVYICGHVSEKRLLACDYQWALGS